MRVNLDSVFQADTFYSREGYQVSFDAPRWKLSKDIDIPIDAISAYLDDQTHKSLRHVLAFYSKSGSQSHVRNLFERCKHYLERTVGLIPFSIESLISYRGSLDTHTEWYMGTLRGLIRQWGRLGYAGISKDALSLLKKWTIKGNEKGYAVQSMCPDTGPFTDIEMGTIADGILNAYGNEELELTDTALAMVLAMTGRRPSQVAALKIKDLIGHANKYVVNFPRAKQRGTPWRTAFKKFPVVEDLWILLQQQAALVEEEFGKIFGAPVKAELIRELPLFPEYQNIDIGVALDRQLEGDNLHVPTLRVSENLDRIEKRITMVSERTGGQIHLNPNRFRYTLGTNLGREGRGVYIIAEALDHSDTQNVGVYVKNLPDIIERIDKAVALQLGPIAQAFQGVLIASESAARRAGDPSSRVCSSNGNVGSCGSYGFCSALAPIACYTCSHFQPWVDGPHEDVLNHLIEDRDRIFESTGDLKIASVNDRLILAVSDVVNRCNVMKGEIANV